MATLSININQEMAIMTVHDVSKIIHVPEFQRDADLDHIKEIRTALKVSLNAGKTPILPGCLIIAHLSSGEHLLIDGNHRLKALCDVDEGQELRVFVNIIHCASRAEAEALFRITNNNLPMMQLPETVKICNVKPLIQYYKALYGKLFSNSKTGNCQKPNLHEKHFGEAIATLLNANYTEQQIKDGITQFNLELSQRLPKTFKVKTSDTIKKMQEHMDTCAAKGGLYLGLVCHNSDYSELLNYFKVYTEPTLLKRVIGLTKGQRINLWNKFFGDARFGKCYVCEAQISITEFHCAHNIAHSNGGTEDPANLYPCCATCNLSMGEMSLQDLDKEC